MRAVLERHATADKPLVLCSKGIEESTGTLLHQVAREACPDAPIAVLSGPTFAHEVAKGLPTAVTLAAEDVALAEQLRDRIARPTFRIYVSDDVAGAEIGGAVKNVLAIACGVVEGKGPRPERPRGADRPRLRRNDAASASPAARSARRSPACRASATSC